MMTSPCADRSYCHRGKLIVKKGGVVTQEVDLAPEYTGEWQFPNAEAPETP